MLVGPRILGGMDLPVMPPVAPMLAKPVAELPVGAFSFEPKWDGFRTIVFRDGDPGQDEDAPTIWLPGRP